MQIHALALELPPVLAHPNRVPFRGVLTLLDAPSDRPPNGARGHRVLITRQAAERALPSLLGMALDYAPGLDTHDARQKIGVITSAEIQPISGLPLLSRNGQRAMDNGFGIVISGHLFARDFPDLLRELRTSSPLLGMSYEIVDSRVADMSAPIWSLTDVTFTGAAVLRRDRAAYAHTSFEIE